MLQIYILPIKHEKIWKKNWKGCCKDFRRVSKALPEVFIKKGLLWPKNEWTHLELDRVTAEPIRRTFIATKCYVQNLIQRHFAAELARSRSFGFWFDQKIMQSIENLVTQIQGLSSNASDITALKDYLKAAEDLLRSESTRLLSFLDQLDPSKHSLGYLYFL